MRKYICITYHMAKLDGETAETCIDLPMDEKIADDILWAQRDSRYVKDAAWPIASILQNLAKLQGYDSSAFCMAKATFGKGCVEKMKDDEMMTLELTRIEVIRIRLALTHVVADFEREISDPHTSEYVKEVGQSSLKMWESLRGKIVEQFDEQDEVEE